MKILVLNAAILAAGDLTETGDSIIASDAIYPKHVVEGAAIVEVAALPDDYAPGRYTYNGGFVPVPPAAPVPSPAEHNAPIFAQIAELEGRQSRAVREALLGMDGAIDRLRALDEQITTLRAELI